jgi:hypothetical protein
MYVRMMVTTSQATALSAGPTAPKELPWAGGTSVARLQAASLCFPTTHRARFRFQDPFQL